MSSHFVYTILMGEVESRAFTVKPEKSLNEIEDKQARTEND